MIFRGLKKLKFYLKNTTAALAILTSIFYFYAGIKNKGFMNRFYFLISFLFDFNFLKFKIILFSLNYFSKYIKPTPILLPINILEDFTKPLSLSFRLFGNILADELVVAVIWLI